MSVTEIVFLERGLTCLILWFLVAMKIRKFQFSNWIAAIVVIVMLLAYASRYNIYREHIQSEHS